MTDQEKIIAEIERLKKELYKQRDFRINGSPIPVYDTNAIEGMLKILEEIKGFINSLPAEQPSGEFKGEFDDYLVHGDIRNPNFDGPFGYDDIRKTAIHFANWQKEQIMKSAIEVKINRDTLYNLKPIIHEKYQDLKIGDKILIIKEDEQ